MENVKAIGEKWGPVLVVDQVKDNIECLTYAKVLVRTNALNKVDARVRLLFENGSCEVWVKECGMCVCKYDASMCRLNKNYGSVDSLERLGTSNLILVSESPLDGGNNEKDNCISVHDDRITPQQKATDSIRMQSNVGGIETTQKEHVDSIRIQDGALVELIEVDYGGCPDPLLSEMRPLSSHDGARGHFDPMASLEAVIQPAAHNARRLGNTVMGNVNKKPRGRPKKQKDSVGTSNCLASVGLDEAHKTWNTTKLLGITSNNEEAVISNLRKSKRLLITDDNSP